ncbi:hypothetical protein [Actinoalloteichus hymeniacidonis]|uniref:DUF485 family protein n=1 Tax=Actinoalloteichus hymeniacidonis TaxID=340345 RepID=A0AAC9HK55_9PSEU|nr:hypothetical protein [Actinoalloteichus hymeniacidonis]AOS60927.1 Protein of unknown function, DUF485 [Actinoalloteichus hymeniacidonis]MBB5911073.1 hypothetical protein [Actinoalloteichus hymeniacidonis]
MIPPDDSRAELPDPDTLEPPPGRRLRRVKVVLADRRAARKPLRELAELGEQTSVGEALVRNLIRAQLRTTLRLTLLVAVLLGVLPLLFWLFPGFATLSIAGIRISWVLLGVLPFPLFIAIGYAYNTQAQRNDRDFIDMVEK